MDDVLAARLAARATEIERDATVAYCVQPLDGGAPIRHRADLAMATASTFKVYLLAALYAGDAAGRLSLGERVEIRADDAVQGSGVLKLLDPGVQLTLRDHARLMIAVSDNVSTNVIIRALGGPAAANAAVHGLPVSLPATAIRDYINFQTFEPFAVSSPDDFTALLTAIFHRRLSGSRAHDEEVHWILRRQQHRGMIARHLPCSEYAEELGIEEYTRCGCKTGSGIGLRADVGIVETRPRSWTLAMQVQGPPDFNTGDEHPFSHLIADFSKLVFDAWGG